VVDSIVVVGAGTVVEVPPAVVAVGVVVVGLGRTIVTAAHHQQQDEMLSWLDRKWRCDLPQT
jgi:hypothetical protein